MDCKRRVRFGRFGGGSSNAAVPRCTEQERVSRLLRILLGRSEEARKYPDQLIPLDDILSLRIVRGKQFRSRV